MDSDLNFCSTVVYNLAKNLIGDFKKIRNGCILINSKVISDRKYVEYLNSMSCRRKLYDNALIFIFKINLIKDLMFFTNKIQYNYERQHYQLRNTKNFDIKFCKTFCKY